MSSAPQGLAQRLRGERIPLWLKVAYTAFVAVLVPYYLGQYGPLNFLWFCDVALVMTLAALWLESPLLASMGAVGIALPQVLWAVDFVVRLATGHHIVNLTEYMFEDDKSLFVRGLSLFHTWLPFLLLWMVWRLGFDRRALACQIAVTWLDLFLCYVLVTDPNGPAGNVNKIFGPSDSAPASQADPRWVLALMVLFPVCLYLPTYFLLRWLMPQRPGKVAV